MNPLVALMTLLRFQGERCDRARFEALQRDRLPGFVALPVAAVLDPRERGIDLGDELALPVAGAQLYSAVRL